MADVINRDTMEIHRSVNTPDHLEPEFMIINGKTLPLCENKYWKIVDDEIVEMLIEEKAVVDYVAPPPEPTPEQIEETRKSNIDAEIAKTHSLTGIVEIITRALAELLPDNEDVQELNTTVSAAIAKYPKE